MSIGAVNLSSEFNNSNLEPLFSSEAIQKRIAEMGAEIARDYAGRDPLLVCVLKGACIFMSDLIRNIDLRLGLEFMAISSYGSSTRTSGEVRILKDLSVPIEGRDIIVVEDIVDTGLTLSYLLANLRARRGQREAGGAARQTRTARKNGAHRLHRLSHSGCFCGRLRIRLRRAVPKPSVHRGG